MRSIATAAVVVTLAALAGPAVGRTTIHIFCGAVGREYEECKAGADAWAAQTYNDVKVDAAPRNSTEQLAFYRERLESKERRGDIDVLQIDVVWVDTLADHLLDLSKSIDSEGVAQHFPAIIRNNTVAGRLVAMPWFSDAGLLYYRRDLLRKHGERPVPETWEEMAETARAVMAAERRTGNERMWGYVFQGRAYEGLTANAVEWLDSHGAGTVVEPGGRISVNNPRAAEALTLAASWVGTIAPPGVLNYTEEGARREFQSGNAVFMRNWPYAWRLVNDVSSKIEVGIAPLPRGGPDGKRTGVLGGMQLAVSRYSSRACEAASLVRYLTSRAEQKRRAIVGGFAPTIKALYEDPAVLDVNPFFHELYDVFSTSTAEVRPSGTVGVRYSQVSEAFWTTVHTILSSRGDAGSELGRLERKLYRIMRTDHVGGTDDQPPPECAGSDGNQPAIPTEPSH